MLSLADRLKQLEEFNRWEREHPAPERPLSDVFADLSFLLTLAPEEIRNTDPDPEKQGVQNLHRLLARYTAAKSSSNDRS